MACVPKKNKIYSLLEINEETKGNVAQSIQYVWIWKFKRIKLYG